MALGTLVFLALLVGFCWYIFTSSDTESSADNKISIAVPKVDEKKIPKNSKFEQYKNEAQDKKRANKSISELIGFGTSDQDAMERDSSSLFSGNTFKDRVDLISQQDSIQRAIQKKSFSHQPATTEEQELDSELKELMELQKQLLSQNNSYQPDISPTEIEELLKQYDQAINDQTSPVDISKTITNIGEGFGAAETKEERASPEISHLPKKLSVSNYFQGAGSVDEKGNVRDLIPAETVDEGLLVNGSTIALRTKKDMKLTKPDLLIPKGAIIYGKVTISTDRLIIDINSYKDGLKLYLLDFMVYDFDGREGVHLGNRTWPRIPSKVAKEVYEYAYQKGTQTPTFGSQGGNIDLEQTKDIAILSAAKNVGNEIFDKRKVFMPKKYHLWFNIQSQ
ncbi:conjugative transposon protein TraM [Allomuricauda taeanensis]|uniref:conjugative transposon protein TraM n=1 Tax=Flagellimonas taeanensis TaxID=1005926 RepID=UPI002E7C53DD|nr:conjugative transposon protein TraM [Allomuricauda taeanensis]MEE1964576.1 conjugative transposon protein TraM [Allomuricauda taeanensis]